MAPRAGIPLLRRAARRALRLDPRAGHAHFYASVPLVIEPDKTAAIDGVSRALRATPRSAVAHYWAASVYASDLKMSYMLIHMQLAVRLQPYALFFQTWRAVALFWAGQPDAAMRHLRDILAFQPCDALASPWLSPIRAYTDGTMRLVTPLPMRTRVRWDDGDGWRPGIRRGDGRTA